MVRAGIPGVTLSRSTWGSAGPLKPLPTTSVVTAPAARRRAAQTTVLRFATRLQLRQALWSCVAAGAAVGGVLAEFGVPWALAEFAAVASQAEHPGRTPSKHKTFIAVALQRLLSRSTVQVVPRRKALLACWEGRRVALQEAESALHAHMHPSLRRVLGGKGVREGHAGFARGEGQLEPHTLLALLDCSTSHGRVGHAAAGPHAKGSDVRRGARVQRRDDANGMMLQVDADPAEDCSGRMAEALGQLKGALTAGNIVRDDAAQHVVGLTTADRRAWEAT